MAITNAVTVRIRHQRERVAFGGAAEIARTPKASTADDAKVPAGLPRAGRPVSLGPANTLARLLMATMRQMAASPARGRPAGTLASSAVDALGVRAISAAPPKATRSR